MWFAYEDLVPWKLSYKNSFIRQKSSSFDPFTIDYIFFCLLRFLLFVLYMFSFLCYLDITKVFSQSLYYNWLRHEHITLTIDSWVSFTSLNLVPALRIISTSKNDEIVRLEGNTSPTTSKRRTVAQYRDCISVGGISPDVWVTVFIYNSVSLLLLQSTVYSFS